MFDPSQACYSAEPGIATTAIGYIFTARVMATG